MPRKTVAKKTPPDGALNFKALVAAIGDIHTFSSANASRAINTSLTLRNWAIGRYIVEYEQRGSDRARYGERLIDGLSEALSAKSGMDLAARSLRLYRQFYLTYPDIWRTPSAKSAAGALPAEIWQTLSAKSSDAAKSLLPAPSATAGVPLDVLFTRLSFSHLAELIALEDPLKRAFYETECLQGAWSVRTLKRQIATLYFERSGLSKNKKKLSQRTHAAAQKQDAALEIRDPYIFEFLGLKAKEIMTESNLEDALIANLQEFLLELGHGFCFEARQKSIVIGKTRGFVDLVFYHRILKCHVLVELKVDEFSHEHLGQLNTYVEWYRKHMMAKGDNPPVGLLLCTKKDSSLVEFVLSSIDNRLFVSKYKVELPSREELQKFLDVQRKEIGD